MNIIIAGGSGGIGQALSQKLSSSGQQVIVLTRNAEENNSLFPMLNCDYSSNSIQQCFDQVQSQFGSIDAVVNLIGSILLKPCQSTTDEEYEDTIATNATTAFRLVRESVKRMQQTGGSIVLMSTVATKIGLANHEAIAMAKSAVNGLVISAAATYASKNIRINAVAPGLVDTPLAKKITSNPLALKASQGMHPLGRIGTAEEVASAIEWLLNPASAWITGQIISVDGGLSSVRGR